MMMMMMIVTTDFTLRHIQSCRIDVVLERKKHVDVDVENIFFFDQ